LHQLAAEGLLAPGKTVVCVLTGHGLKDPDWAIAGAPTPAVIEPDPDAAASELGL
jgi:threonine synthase